MFTFANATLITAPVGVATTNPKWRAKFKGSPDHVVNFMMGVAEEAREIMASLGVRSMNELIGRPQKFLAQRDVPDHPKANTLDLKKVLSDKGDENAVRICTQDRNDGIHKPALDLQILKDLATHTGTTEEENPTAGLMDRGPFTKEYEVVNTDRNIGTRTAGRVAEIYENHGLPSESIDLTFRGSAGQSFGTFLCGGIKLTLIGEGNDYVGKGMSNGELIVRPPAVMNSDFIAAKNSIVGNTCLYGATGGKLFVNGRAGERFCVRNSGSTSVVEGVGDHGCEYMTNGATVILGLTGKNFGAGMSGGIAYIYDIDGMFQSRLNPEMVVARPVKRAPDIKEVKSLIKEHYEKTDSPRAKELLENWDLTLTKLIRVIAKEKYDLEKAEEEHEAAVAVD
ncbi:glutamate synthase-related protein [Akkermansiaceae bacterium]|nr:glutamate synthase-related protein [Akkermansiaceae bacterium]